MVNAKFEFKYTLKMNLKMFFQKINKKELEILIRHWATGVREKNFFEEGEWIYETITYQEFHYLVRGTIKGNKIICGIQYMMEAWKCDFYEILPDDAHFKKDK